MSTIKAIETKYKGYRFRSRLEARWAVFFDALRIRWEYEPQGFLLGEDLYLPDFFLPFPKPVLVGMESTIRHWRGWRNTQAYWVEVKPGDPSEHEKELMLRLAAQTQHHVYCFAGSPWPGEAGIWLCSIQGCCRLLGRDLGLGFLLYGFLMNTAPDPDESLPGALAAARSARFEHGETPH